MRENFLCNVKNIIYLQMNIIINDLSLHLRKSSRYVRHFSSTFSLRSDEVPEEAIPKNIIQKYYNSHLQEKGAIYDKRPFKMKLQANKKYAFCTCGQSKSQPLCDGTHKIQTLLIKNKPILFMVAESKEYWLCNCKQSKHRPFCDGTHKKEHIQSALKYYKM